MGKQISRTFHGRDVFAPAAAHLASKKPPAQFGKLIQDYLRGADLQPRQLEPHRWRGIILKIDRFGNLITNFHIERFPGLKTHAFEVQVGLEKISRLALTYSETEIGEVFAIVGSSGYLEIAANQENAAKKLGCSNGAPVELEVF